MTKKEQKTRLDTLKELDESDREFVLKQNKRDRKKILDEISGDSPRKTWGKNFFKKKKES